MSVILNRQRIQAPEFNNPIILVVEDEEDNLLFISHALIFLKYNFITARTGKEALDLATKYEVDLMLLDLVLPDINGFELVGQLKQNKLTQNMPIVAISALVRPQERDRALEVGCVDFLEKPYFLDDLNSKIRQYLPQSFFPRTSSFLKKPQGRQNQLPELFCY